MELSSKILVMGEII